MEPYRNESCYCGATKRNGERKRYKHCCGRYYRASTVKVSEVLKAFKALVTSRQYKSIKKMLSLPRKEVAPGSYLDMLSHFNTNNKLSNEANNATI